MVRHPTDEKVIHLPLDVGPPVGAELSRTFGHVDRFGGVGGVEGVHLGDGAGCKWGLVGKYCG